MQLTKDQIRALPEELRHFDGLAPDGATPWSLAEFEAAQRAALGLPEPLSKRRKIARSASADLLNEITWLLDWAAKRRPTDADRDRMNGIREVVVWTTQRQAEVAERLRLGAQKAREARASESPLHIKLELTDYENNKRVVSGWTEAGMVVGRTANALRVTMARAKRRGQSFCTIGRRNKPESLWRIKPLA